MSKVQSRSWQTKFVKCPYYKKHDLHQIVCEGINNESSTHIVFGAETDTKRHMQKYCNDIGGCRACPMHDLLDRKYGDED